jgi:hypothetical protein
VVQSAALECKAQPEPHGPEEPFAFRRPQLGPVLPGVGLVIAGVHDARRLVPQHDQRTGHGDRLDYPNMEVREAFSQYLVESYTNVEKSIVPAYLRRLLAALESGDMDRAMQTLRIFFADIPYDIQLSNEKYYQTIFHVLLRLLALDVDCKVRTEPRQRAPKKLTCPSDALGVCASPG